MGQLIQAEFMGSSYIHQKHTNWSDLNTRNFIHKGFSGMVCLYVAGFDVIELHFVALKKKNSI